MIVLMACGAPTSAAADSRVTGVIGGPSTVQRGQEAVYTVTLRNAGTQTLGTGSPRLAMDLDSIPSSGARLTDAVQVGGTGPWTCGASGCTIARNVTFPPGATASFAVLVKVFRSTTLDLDVTGNEVSFSNVRRSIRTSGTLVPVLYGLSMPATISPRTGPIGFTLSEPARVTVAAGAHLHPLAAAQARPGRVCGRSAARTEAEGAADHAGAQGPHPLQPGGPHPVHQLGRPRLQPAGHPPAARAARR